MRIIVGAFITLIAACAEHAWAFNASDLDGLWAETTQTRYACTSTNRHQRLALSQDGKTLTLTLIFRSTARRNEVINFEVDRSDEHSIYFQFPGNHPPPDPLSGVWAITMLGPGVYRWHSTSEHESPTAAPIGVRCEP